MTPKDHERAKELRVILAARNFVEASEPVLAETTSDPNLALRLAVQELADWHGSDMHLLADIDQELDHLSELKQPHVWQEYNAHGNTCHYPDCALTEAEHPQELTEAPGWVERTMADVRSGDTIRMVGREETRREVAGALHVPWHVADPSAAGSAEQARDIQYNPNRYQQRWSEIRLAFIDGGKYSFDPMMNVEIWLSPSEVAAIEMIGWEHRIGLAARNADES